MTCYMHGHVIRIASHTFDNIKLSNVIITTFEKIMEKIFKLHNGLLAIT